MNKIAEGKLESRLSRLDGKIEHLKVLKMNSVKSILIKTWDFAYVLRIGGAVIRKYQKPLAERLGWEEKDLTIRSAVYMGVLPNIMYAVLNQYFGDNVGESFQNGFYIVPLWGVVHGFSRAIYAQVTKKAIGSISVENLVGSSIYSMAEKIERVK